MNRSELEQRVGAAIGAAFHAGEPLGKPGFIAEARAALAIIEAVLEIDVNQLLQSQQFEADAVKAAAALDIAESGALRPQPLMTEGARAYTTHRVPSDFARDIQSKMRTAAKAEVSQHIAAGRAVYGLSPMVKLLGCVESLLETVNWMNNHLGTAYDDATTYTSVKEELVLNRNILAALMKGAKNDETGG